MIAVSAPVAALTAVQRAKPLIMRSGARAW
jgi:hypothetical protein